MRSLMWVAASAVFVAAAYESMWQRSEKYFDKIPYHTVLDLVTLIWPMFFLCFAAVLCFAKFITAICLN